MPRLSRLVIALAAFAALWLGSASSVKADPITITFINPTQSIVYPNLTTYSAVITNPNPQAIVSIQVITWNPNAPGGFILHFSQELHVLRTFGLAGGASTGPIPLFSVGIAGAELLFTEPFPKVFNGTFSFSSVTLRDPVSGAFSSTQGQANFTMIIPAAAVPEPASLILLGTGLAGIAAGIRRRRAASAKG